MILKRQNVSSVEELVRKNTGMTTEELLDDRKVYKIHGIDQVRDVIIDAKKQNKKIYLFGDYDVDGVCASAIITVGMRAFGYDHMLQVRFPKRFTEGYGITEKAIDEFEDGNILITVDNGIAAFDAIKKAKEKGMYVIVIDHHIPMKDEKGNVILPPADIIIDPKAIPGQADFDGYCGAGLAYRVMCKLVYDRKTVMKMICLAAVATIADVMPLVGENRRIVRYGLLNMTDVNVPTIGLYALISVCGCNEFVTEESIAYKIAPCLNAPGRLLDYGSFESYNLLAHDGDLALAKQLAAKQLEYNESRKDFSDEWKDSAKRYMEEKNLTAPIIMRLDGIPEGIVGIVAGKISEYAKAPCIILAESRENPDYLKGSARTYGDVDLYSLISSGSEYLLRFGGHKEAAGLTLSKEQFDAFNEKLHKVFKDKYPETEQDNNVYFDIEVAGNDRNAIRQIIEDVDRFRPYGQGNPAPVIYLKNLALIPQVGNQYFRYLGEGNAAVKLNSVELDCISFEDVTKYEKMGSPAIVNAVGTLTKSYYMGNTRDQLEFFEIEPGTEKRKQSTLAALIAKKAAERG